MACILTPNKQLYTIKDKKLATKGFWHSVALPWKLLVYFSKLNYAELELFFSEGLAIFLVEKMTKEYMNVQSPMQLKRNLKIQNIGHATTLIQANGLNGITDPVFNDLNPLLYPAKTKPGLDLDDLPWLDYVVLSHNHRDHCDEKALRALVKKNPNLIICVPKSDVKLMERYGFKPENIRGMEWGEQVTIEKGGKTVTITTTPSHHWANRGLMDANLSSVNGYTIAPEGKDIVYFAGDTAVMDPAFMKQIAAILRVQMMAHGDGVPPKLINLEPGGPNYRRSLMQSTHQSTLDSISSAFKLANAIAEIENELVEKESWRHGIRNHRKNGWPTFYSLCTP